MCQHCYDLADDDQRREDARRRTPNGISPERIQFLDLVDDAADSVRNLRRVLDEKVQAETARALQRDAQRVNERRARAAYTDAVKGTLFPEWEDLTDDERHVWLDEGADPVCMCEVGSPPAPGCPDHSIRPATVDIPILPRIPSDLVEDRQVAAAVSVATGDTYSVVDKGNGVKMLRKVRDENPRQLAAQAEIAERARILDAEKRRVDAAREGVNRRNRGRDAVKRSAKELDLIVGAEVQGKRCMQTALEAGMEGDTIRASEAAARVVEYVEIAKAATLRLVEIRQHERSSVDEEALQRLRGHATQTERPLALVCQYGHAVERLIIEAPAPDTSWVRMESDEAGKTGPRRTLAGWWDIAWREPMAPALTVASASVAAATTMELGALAGVGALGAWLLVVTAPAWAYRHYLRRRAYHRELIARSDAWWSNPTEGIEK